MDYIKDGLLYCGNCHTPKQWRGTLFGQERVMPCLCKCEKERQEQEEQEQEKERQQKRIKALRDDCFDSKEMHSWTFERDDRADKRLSEVCENYVHIFPYMLNKGKGILFYGSVGTGKTFFSACIANALIDQGISCMMTSVSRLATLMAGSKIDITESLNGYTLLILDDLASERETEYMQEYVQMVIDARYRSHLPLIVTTNLTPEELKHPADRRKARIYSRLFEMCIPVEVKGKDRRKEKLRADYAELRGVLNV